MRRNASGWFASSVTPEELQKLADSNSERSGWDFSPMRLREECPAWEWQDVVRQHLQPHHAVLDLGTGGGEVFLSFADAFAVGLGMDANSDRLRVAVANRRRVGATNVAFVRMHAEQLGLADSSQDGVLASFAAYNPAEVARVLRPGGVFITCQMGDRDTQNIFDAFGWGSYGAYWRRRYQMAGATYTATADTARQFESLGCSVIRYDEYDTRQWFLDVESLVFYLQFSPLPLPFDAATYAGPVSKLLATSTSERGIESNAHRELLVVRR